MKTYKVAALLLRYPEADWLRELSQLAWALEEERRRNHRAADTMAPLFQFLEGPLIESQMHYVETFDRTPAHGLYLFEHLHGESRERGNAMVTLLERYRQHGLELDCNELPDHLPVFLEFLSILPRRKARAELRPVASALRLLARRLGQAQSPYASVFVALARLAPRGSADEAVRASRPMEQLLEREGRSAQGDEPLLTPEKLVPIPDISRRRPASRTGGNT
ncbi:MAG TPA: nitrate reductase molybdenum cofactor assembly chaperone [Steroidobacteraceae bacterium]|nr:nitrate reductase molybdenum cofactor assembly chaperone [Steroidobacteraceae bacterium]